MSKQQSSQPYPNYIRYYCKQQGYTIQALADKIGISRRTLTDYVTGIRPVPRSWQMKIARALRCSIKEIIPAPGEKVYIEEKDNIISTIPFKMPPQREEEIRHKSSRTSQVSTTPDNMIPISLLNSTLADVSVHTIEQSAPLHSHFETLIEQNFSNSLLPMLPSVTTSQENSLDMLSTSHRHTLHMLLTSASTALVLTSHLEWPTQDNEKENNSANQAILEHLEHIALSYWRLCANTSLDLLSNLLEHFQATVHLLKQPQQVLVSLRFYALAGEFAQLVGKTLFDVHEYTLAWFYYVFSLKAAQVASNHDLWAAGLGRMSLLLIYWKQDHAALPLLQEAKQLTLQSLRIQCWLAAIEAEVCACLGDVQTCDAALSVARKIAANNILDEDRYATGFNLSRLAGYEGACFMRLHQPHRALPALQRALELLDPQSIRRQSRLLTDIAMAYAQQQDVQKACKFAKKALAITVYTKSVDVFGRIQDVYTELRASKDREDVQVLSKQIESVSILIKQKNGML